MEAPPLERKLVAILAADVEGYSRHMGTNEEGALATLSAHRAIVDALITGHRGRIASTAGDSVLAEFASIFDAVPCAVQIQSALAEANEALPEDRRMLLRIGINIGDVMVKDGDIFGDGVNIAARLETLAEPGGICVSRGVRDQIRRQLPFGFEDLGEQRVKNIAQPIRVFRLRFDGQHIPEDDAASELPGSSLDAALAEAEATGTIAAAPPDPQTVDLTFWESIKDSDRPSDYEAYLERFPDGTFAPLARTRLADPDLSAAAEPDPQDLAVELAFWNTVKDSDNPAMLHAYLEKYPDGEFKPLAEIRIAELNAPPSGSGSGNA